MDLFGGFAAVKICYCIIMCKEAFFIRVDGMQHFCSHDLTAKRAVIRVFALRAVAQNVWFRRENIRVAGGIYLMISFAFKIVRHVDRIAYMLVSVVAHDGGRSGRIQTRRIKEIAVTLPASPVLHPAVVLAVRVLRLITRQAVAGSRDRDTRNVVCKFIRAVLIGEDLLAALAFPAGLRYPGFGAGRVLLVDLLGIPDLIAGQRERNGIVSAGEQLACRHRRVERRVAGICIPERQAECVVRNLGA